MRWFKILLVVLLFATAATCTWWLWLRNDGVLRFTITDKTDLIIETPAGARILHILEPGEHRFHAHHQKLYLDDAEVWDHSASEWQLWAIDSTNPILIGHLGDEWNSTKVPVETPAAENSGVPVAIASDDKRIFLGWSAMGRGALLAATDPAGKVLWSLPRIKDFGITGLAVSDGVLFSLQRNADAPSPGGALVKIDPATGRTLEWSEGRGTLLISSLWPADSAVQPPGADYIAAANGRIYLSFTGAGFIAVLDAKNGNYVTTLSGPEPGPMALSTTPMVGTDGAVETVDFGVAVLMKKAVSYFVMPHDPPWVAANTTRWMAQDERIVAFTMRADTMKSGDVQLFLALEAPHAQIQRRPALDPSGFTLAVGKAGGRSERGPWDANAVLDVRAMAIDSAGQLWVAEGASTPKRISVWATEGTQARLVREHFDLSSETSSLAFVWPDDADSFIAGGCEWRLDPATGRTICEGVIAPSPFSKAWTVESNGRTLLAATFGNSPVKFYERVSAGNWTDADGPTKEMPPSDDLKLPGVGKLSSGDGFMIVKSDLGGPRITQSESSESGARFRLSHTKDGTIICADDSPSPNIWRMPPVRLIGSSPANVR